MFRRLVERLLPHQHRGWTEMAVRDLLAQRQWERALAAARNLNPKTPDREVTSLCLQGEVHYQRQDDVQAEACYRQALALKASHAEAHLGLSMVLSEKASDQKAALEHALFAKNLSPENPRTLAQLGYCHMLLEGYPAAEGALRLALSHDPQDKRSWNNLAVTLRSRGDVAQAKACWLQALAIDPSYASARDNMARLDAELMEAGVAVTLSDEARPAAAPSLHVADSVMPWPAIDALASTGQVEAALNLAERHSPPEPSAAETLAINDLYRRSGDWLTATTQLQTHLAKTPQDGAVWRRLGEVHARREQHKEAIEAYQRAIEFGEECADLLADLSVSQHALERYQDALISIQKACELDDRSKYQERLAATLLMCCRYEDSVRVYDQLHQNKNHTYTPNHALSLAGLGRLAEALVILDKIIDTSPHDPAVRMMRGQILLLKQDWGPGWLDYTWRGFSQTKFFRMLPFPRWQGEPLKGKRIVVLAEQGLGDQVMFASCLPDLIALEPAHTVLEAHERVAKTLARSFPTVPVIPTRQKKDLAWVQSLGAMDYFVALGDLPRFFRPTDSAFPKTAYLQPDPERVAHWRTQLRQAGPGPWIGFSWRGGTEVTRSVLRTMDIMDFARMAKAVPGTWVSLQYGAVDSDLTAAREQDFLPVHWPDAITDLDEFAALVAALDVVVTVCNTTVHYAGSLGRPTLVLAPKVPEWRYGIDSTTMAWYPDATVLRQHDAGHWADVISDATCRLAKVVTTQQPVTDHSPQN